MLVSTYNTGGRHSLHGFPSSCRMSLAPYLPGPDSAIPAAGQGQITTGGDRDALHADAVPFEATALHVGPQIPDADRPVKPHGEQATSRGVQGKSSHPCAMCPGQLDVAPIVVIAQQDPAVVSTRCHTVAIPQVDQARQLRVAAAKYIARNGLWRLSAKLISLRTFWDDDAACGDEDDEERGAVKCGRDLVRPLIAGIDALVVPDAVALLVQGQEFWENLRRVLMRVTHEDVGLISGVGLEACR